MAKDNSNKSMGWLKGVLSNQAPIDSNNEEKEHAPIEVAEVESNTVSEPENNESSSNKHLFSRENQDKVALDMIVSLENMIKDRQLIIYKNKDLTDQLNNANELISRLKQEQAKKEQLLEEKNQELNTLEGKLTHKQMSYDQLLEDYKDYQNTSNNEFENIKTQLEKETTKYNKLNEEATRARYESMNKINQLEETIRDLQVENQKYVEQYKEIVEEKNQLMQTINEFTERMSFSFSPKKSES